MLESLLRRPCRRFFLRAICRCHLTFGAKWQGRAFPSRMSLQDEATIPTEHPETAYRFASVIARTLAWKYDKSLRMSTAYSVILGLLLVGFFAIAVQLLFPHSAETAVAWVVHLGALIAQL